MSIETETPSRFADALEKVRLLVEARQQVEKLETFVRNERMRLAHAASKASSDHDNLLEACASTKFRDKARLVSASASSFSQQTGEFAGVYGGETCATGRSD